MSQRDSESIEQRFPQVIDQFDGLGQFIQARSDQYVVSVGGLGEHYFDDRSDASFAWAAARKAYEWGRIAAFAELRRLIGAKHDY